MPNAARMFPTLDYAPSTFDACDGADVVLHLTERQEFRALDPFALAQVVRAARVLDGRNCLDADAWRGAGWTYRGKGRR